MLRAAALAAALVAAGSASAGVPHVRAYEAGYATYFRLGPDDAVTTAHVCDRDLERCGTLLVGDGPQFASDCDVSGTVVGERILRAVADARTKGPGWGVVTRTENGGYPFTCAFEAAPDLCPHGGISRRDLAALPVLERVIALAERFFCLG